MKDVLIFVETRQGNIRKASFDAVTAGKELAGKLGGKAHALVIADDASKYTDELAKYGPDAVLTASAPEYKDYSSDLYREALLNAIEKVKPALLIAAQSSMATDFIPGAAAITGSGMATDCLGVDIDSGKVTVKKPVYAGKLIADMAIETETAFVTIRPNVFPAKEQSGDAAVTALDAKPSQPKAKVTEIKTSGDELDVSEADVIVSGGRGVKGPEGFEPLKELADLLEGAVGASRSAVDSEWIEHQHQVGQTGKTVSPLLYIAAGISGKIQHLAGMSSSKYIVAINKDAEAPIFDVADLGIVGDLFEVMPLVIEKVKALK